jgi:hypothetical protein
MTTQDPAQAGFTDINMKGELIVRESSATEIPV